MLLWPRSVDAGGAAKDVAIRFCRRRAIVIKILICYNITINA
jgi:hypothetical protein